MCHPGFVDAELQRLDPLTSLREREYLFLIDDSFPSLLEARGFTAIDKLLICDCWG
jgi:chitin disaccharide deacetylase